MDTSSEQKPSSRMGRISLIMGILGWMVWCVYFVVFGVVIGGNMGFGSLDSESMGYLVALGGPLIASLLTILFTISGLTTGILALRKKEPQRGLAIGGIILSLMCIIPYLLLVVLLLASTMLGGKQ